jgi:hypothetical protein
VGISRQASATNSETEVSDMYIGGGVLAIILIILILILLF